MFFLSGEVGVQVTDEQGRDVPLETVDNGDGTFNVEYEPQSVGTYTVEVFYSDQPVPNTPIKVNVQSSIDLSKVKVVGLEPSKFTSYKVNLIYIWSVFFFFVIWQVVFISDDAYYYTMCLLI